MASEGLPWEKGHRSYAGWVPNIRNHLSFSMIGAARNARAFTQPVDDGRTRVVLVLQHRVINDYPLPDRCALRKDPGIAADWLIEAETQAVELPVRRRDKIEVEPDRQGCLRGTVRYVPYYSDEDERDAAKKTIDEIAGLLSSKRQPEMTAGKELRKEVVAAIDGLPYSVTFEFALMRTGECRLWYPAAIPGWDDVTHDRIASQAYYFIKDMVHDHTHHDPTSDQITPLTWFDPNSTEPGHENDVKWRRETMWSLSREVERLNRSRDIVDQHRSLGIIAYAEEFQDSLLGHVRDVSKPIGFAPNSTVHDFQFDHLKASIKAQIDVKSTSLAQRIQRWVASAATFISGLALISSAVSTHNASIIRGSNGVPVEPLVKFEPPEWVLRCAAHMPLFAALIMGLVVALVISFFVRGGLNGLKSDTQRIISQTIRAATVTWTSSTRVQRWTATILNLLAAVLIAWAYLGLFYWIFYGMSW